MLRVDSCLFIEHAVAVIITFFFFFFLSNIASWSKHLHAVLIVRRYELHTLFQLLMSNSLLSLSFLTLCSTGVLPFRLQEQFSVQQNPDATRTLLPPQPHWSGRTHVPSSKVETTQRFYTANGTKHHRCTVIICLNMQNNLYILHFGQLL